MDTLVYESENPEGSAAGMSLASFIVTVAMLSSPLNDMEKRIRPEKGNTFVKENMKYKVKTNLYVNLRQKNIKTNKIKMQ